MKTLLLSLMGMLVAVSLSAADNGKPAPTFKATTADGKEVELKSLKGKTVVLEWFNEGCPFVKKHYESGNMQKIQNAAMGKGVVWLSVLSSAPGKQGYADAAGAKKIFHDWKSTPSHIVLDPKGVLGKLYSAKTTPHMYVIDKNGTLVYQGAIDSNDSSDPRTIASSTNYVTAALDAVAAGKPVATASTKAYGCGVKYE